MEKPHKYDLGIIGNCAYLALIDTTANVRWMCWPRFDSSFIFGGLMDEEDGGEFYIRPGTDDYTSSQQYLTNTNVLETTFEAETGSFKVTDFAPRFFNHGRAYKPLALIRKVEPISGRPHIRVSCDPRGRYGKVKPTWVFGSSHIRYEGLDAPVRLTTNVPLTYVENRHSFVLSETYYLFLTWGVPLEGTLEDTVGQFLDRTIHYWQYWVQNTSTESFRQGAVIRSALALKLHQFQETGAIIAAATTSLPEAPGSGRTWDYRYCWLRDAHYTLRALNDLSHFNILKDYARFIENILMDETKRYHPLYPICNGKMPDETILPLAGYRGEQPVRIGNQAYEHTQNDVYGQVLVTLLPFYTDQRLLNQPGKVELDIVNNCVNMIEATMEEPDNGIWEFRGMAQLHAYTFLFHWAGSQAALRIGEILDDKKLMQRARKLIKRSSEMIEACYDAERGVYTQAVGSPHLDASLLQLINMGFLAPNSSKARRHLKVLEEELRTPGGLF
ncbi:MAG: glycoside hydrolase family 15 protein, partial [Lewinella sp.]|nr:glycoside hydrolase family 15 protein [Lewinella sp.]